MRLLLLAPQYPPTLGGAELQAQRLAQELNANGVRVTVLTQPLASADAEEDERGVRVLRKLDGIPLGPLWGLTFMLNTERWLRRLAAEWDIVHNQQVGLHSWSSLRAAASLGKPCLLRFACSGEGGDLATLSSRRFGSKLVRALHGAGRYVALTNGGAAEIARFGLSEAKTRVIPNGIDVSKFGIQPWPQLGATEPLRLLFVGRLSHQKGLDVLLAALALLDRPEAFHLRVVGIGNELQALRQQARELGLERMIEFVGSKRDVIAEYSWSEMVVFPSRFEGMPNVVLEALACGRPVLGTRVDGTVDLVEENCNGWLVPSEDPHALAAALRNVEQQRCHLARVGAAGRDIVEARHALKRTAGMYVNEYEALLAGPRRR